MTWWFIYSTEAAAEAAQADIAARLGLGRPGMVTSRWADPRLTKAGKWAIPSPDADGVPEPEWPE